MDYVIRVELDDEVKEALKQYKNATVSRRVGKVENDQYWLERLVREVLLKPDERQRAIRAGYGR